MSHDYVVSQDRCADGAARTRQALIHPYVDFLCLGGLSLLCLVAVMVFPAHSISIAQASLYSVMMSHVINAPPFCPLLPFVLS